MVQRAGFVLGQGTESNGTRSLERRFGRGTFTRRRPLVGFGLEDRVRGHGLEEQVDAGHRPTVDQSVRLLCTVSAVRASKWPGTPWC